SMLMFSPKYGPHFRKLAENPVALPIADLERDLRVWVNGPKPVLPLPGVPGAGVAAQIADVPSFETQQLLAEVLMVSGKLDLAEQRYRELVQERPDSANLHAALGAVAFQKGDRAEAQTRWKQAIALGVTDAALCFRYTALASTAGVPPDEIRPALERAVALRPDFDDARYDLALLEKNAGHDEIAVGHLQTMAPVARARA